MENIRAEIAASAARFIAEDGLDYGSAKRKATAQVLGELPRGASNLLPSNSEIEEEVRVYQRLFQSDSQPALLAARREVALDWLRRLSTWLQEADLAATTSGPFVTGAVWNGTASAHSPVRLELYLDNPKDAEIFLLNAGIDYQVEPLVSGDSSGDAGEFLHFAWQDVDICLYLYEYVAQHRGSGRSATTSDNAAARSAQTNIALQDGGMLPLYRRKERGTWQELLQVMQEDRGAAASAAYSGR
ncbi:UDP-N-acetylmuramate--alanine ligase [Parvibium lacunae]|uniref:UDP-N-acetylmuramate--alanine ligase n=1 Tax=Parvibium lacunae TaxID=1888893 RepID=A0A368L201_9BURK|nr:UDP-N-acetylmuramate--alanine ligase [Parvibium lacunae]RCS57584.1 UDP-N-acetylmuramate--alanine ligase [Parvibium lacunae]